MKKMIVLGQEEHIWMCYNFVQFDAFGTMSFQEAMDQLHEGHLKFDEVAIPPFAKAFSVVEFTDAGRDFLCNMQKIWDEIYRPQFEDPAFSLHDEYKIDPLISSEFVMSRERLELERRAGRLNKVLERCPKIELLD